MRNYRAPSATATVASTPEGMPAPPTQQRRDKDYTDADVQGAWRHAVREFASDPLLNSILSAAEIGRGEAAHTLRITVGADIQADAVRKVIATLRGVMRDQLSNDSVDIDIDVLRGELPPKFWTEKQVLEHLVVTHPIVQDFIDRYKLRMV